MHREARRVGPQGLVLGILWIQLALQLALLCGSSAAAAAQAPDASQNPGYVDFGGLGLFTAEDLDVQVAVKAPMLQLVAAATRSADPDLATMVSRLQQIEVRVYKIGRSPRVTIRKKAREMAQQLQDQGWEAAMTIETREQQVYMHLKIESGKTQGLTAMMVGESEAVFLNIVGEVDPAQVGRLARKFDLDLPVPPQDPPD